MLMDGDVRYWNNPDATPEQVSAVITARWPQSAPRSGPDRPPPAVMCEG